MQEVADGVWRVTAGAFPSNSYICRTAPGRAVLIDTGLDAEPIEAALQALGVRPTQLFCTHGHFDHLGSASAFQARYGVPVYLHRADLNIARANNFLLMAMKMDVRITVPDLTLIDDGFEIELGDASLIYRHTPGHTPGSCVIACGRQLFSGDTLFAHGLALSKLPGEKPDQLRRSLLDLWPSLDQYTVHPGHGPSGSGSSIKFENEPLRTFLGHAQITGATHDL